MKAELIIGLLFAFVTVFGLNPSAGQTNEAAQVFKPALDQIRGHTQIPILLPSKFPAAVREPDIKLAWGTATDSGYNISLYYTEIRNDVAFAASFGGSKQVFRDLPNTRPVVLASGIVAMFRSVSCGGSCAPANLWWEQKGVMYQIQITLRSNTNEMEQERILMETANSSVTVRKQ
jgi:hypothetical protein